jgi:hypothetical protein
LKRHESQKHCGTTRKPRRRFATSTNDDAHYGREADDDRQQNFYQRKCTCEERLNADQVELYEDHQKEPECEDGRRPERCQIRSAGDGHEGHGDWKNLNHMAKERCADNAYQQQRYKNGTQTGGNDSQRLGHRLSSVVSAQRRRFSRGGSGSHRPPTAASDC